MTSPQDELNDGNKRCDPEQAQIEMMDEEQVVHKISEKLQAWQRGEQIPVPPSLGQKIILLQRAIRAGSTIRIAYRGGSHPNKTRLIQPTALFQVEGHHEIYLQANCLPTGKSKTFNLSRLSILTEELLAQQGSTPTKAPHSTSHSSPHSSSHPTSQQPVQYPDKHHGQHPQADA